MAIGQAPGDGRLTLDAAGRVVCPGFIDVHAHIDGDKPWDLVERCAGLSLAQGVTTLISGNCGFSPVPIGPFLARIDKGFPVHVGELVGASGPMRRQVGLKGNHDVANAQQIASMQHMCREAIREGALGISFGPGYVPGTSLEEMIALSRVAADQGCICAIDTRMEGPEDLYSLQEAIEMARHGGGKVQVSHFVYQYGEGVMSCALEMMEQARQSGLSLWADSGMYVYWASGVGAELFREDYVLDTPGLLHQLLMATGEHTGQRLDEALYRHVRQEHANDSVICLTGMLESIDEALRAPYVMPSSDTAPYMPGQGHPQVAGSFAGFFARVREHGLMPLEEAVYRATYLPAVTFNLSGKGRLELGADADLTVFDPSTIRDRARFCDQGRPDEMPEGIQYVLVDGKLAIDHGLPTAACAGRALKGAGGYATMTKKTI
nr:amidohydrolase family protein [bacterium]